MNTWSPYLGPPWTFALAWPFAIYLANDRAEVRNVKQRVSFNHHNHQWEIEDVRT